MAFLAYILLYTEEGVNVFFTSFTTKTVKAFLSFSSLHAVLFWQTLASYAQGDVTRLPISHPGHSLEPGLILEADMDDEEGETDEDATVVTDDTVEGLLPWAPKPNQVSRNAILAVNTGLYVKLRALKYVVCGCGQTQAKIRQLWPTLTRFRAVAFVFSHEISCRCGITRN